MAKLEVPVSFRYISDSLALPITGFAHTGLSIGETIKLLNEKVEFALYLYSDEARATWPFLPQALQAIRENRYMANEYIRDPRFALVLASSLHNEYERNQLERELRKYLPTSDYKQIPVKQKAFGPRSSNVEPAKPKAFSSGKADITPMSLLVTFVQFMGMIHGS